MCTLHLPPRKGFANKDWFIIGIPLTNKKCYNPNYDDCYWVGVGPQCAPNLHTWICYAGKSTLVEQSSMIFQFIRNDSKMTCGSIMIEFFKMHVCFDGIVTSPTWETSSAPPPPKKKGTLSTLDSWNIGDPKKFQQTVSNQTRFTQKMPMESFPLLYFHQPTEWPRKKTGCNCSGPGVQSHSHSQVWEVADDIHVGGVHRSFNFQAGRGMCAVVGSVGFFPPGGDLQGLAVKPHGMSVYVSKVCYPPAN